MFILKITAIPFLLLNGNLFESIRRKHILTKPITATNYLKESVISGLVTSFY